MMESMNTLVGCDRVPSSYKLSLNGQISKISLNVTKVIVLLLFLKKKPALWRKRARQRVESIKGIISAYSCHMHTTVILISFKHTICLSIRWKKRGS
jgi:hypothetical protein